eukprot:jgi/Mesvir1/24722/Mv21992-RA.1
MVTVVFSRAVVGFNGFDAVIRGTSYAMVITTLVTGNGTHFTFGLTPTTSNSNVTSYDNLVSIQIKAGAANATDNGEVSVASNILEVLVDRVPPYLYWVGYRMNMTLSLLPVQMGFRFTEVIYGWDWNNVIFDGQNITYDFEEPNGIDFIYKQIPPATVDFDPPLPYGAYDCSGVGLSYMFLNKSIIRDKAGNAYGGTGRNGITWTCWKPWAIVETNATGPRRDPFTVLVTWNNPMLYFGQEQVVVQKGSISAFTMLDTPFGSIGTGSKWSFVVTPTADGTLTVDIPPGTVHGLTTLRNVYPQPFQTTKVNISIQVDITGPTVVISSAVTATNISPIVFTATFNEPVSNVTLVAFVATNGAIASGAFTSATVYAVTVTPAAQGAVTLQCLAGKGISDSLGNPHIYNSNIRTVIYDTVRPTVSLTTSSASVTNVLPVPLTATFSEPVYGFNETGVSLQGGWSVVSGSLSGSGAVYTFSTRPTALPGGAALVESSSSQETGFLGYDAAGNMVRFDPP